ncbi:hypothetical protein CEP53_013958 [Fusarium sp. AF-6]|nr:hypothetical protein CEP53_013958 [Fusarium sp. AF-6]
MLALLSPFIFIRNAILNLFRVYQILSGKNSIVTRRRELDGKEFDYTIVQRPEGPFLPALPIKPAPGTEYAKTIIPKGHRKEPCFKALDQDMIFEQNVCITMRDGIKLYVDIYRPVQEDLKCPVIMAWGPYGKHLNNKGMLSTQPCYVGMKTDDYSGYENFEGPDPAFWVPRGYAIVNVDIRGSWHSEGFLHYWGKQEQNDGWDVTEYLAALPWCNGKIGMSGNSWLAISQWHVASAQPPHLAAIAPWEGMSDGYRDQHRRGGIPSPAMPSFLGLIIPSVGLIEDGGSMATKNPFWNEYWDDKKADLAKITVPAYVVASYSSKFHVSGTFRGFKNISSKNKWLRVHATQEWYDYLQEQEDLVKFFDYFLKGIQNDWPSTPLVRLSILRHNKPPITNVPYSTYPPPEAVPTKFYLDASTSKGSLTPPKKGATKTYQAGEGGETHFDIIFDKKTTLAGYPTLLLHMQCHDSDDLDVFVILRKLDKDGKQVDHVNYPCSVLLETIPKRNITFLQGPTGVIRASHREVVESQETYPGEIFHPHTKEEKVEPGTIVALKFSTWPIGTMYDEGEAVRLSIGGRDLGYPEDSAVPVDRNHNKGSHIIHTGGNLDSHILLPVIS